MTSFDMWFSLNLWFMVVVSCVSKLYWRVSSLTPTVAGQRIVIVHKLFVNKSVVVFYGQLRLFGHWPWVDGYSCGTAHRGTKDARRIDQSSLRNLCVPFGFARSHSGHPRNSLKPLLITSSGGGRHWRRHCRQSCLFNNERHDLLHEVFARTARIYTALLFLNINHHKLSTNFSLIIYDPFVVIDGYSCERKGQKNVVGRNLSVLWAFARWDGLLNDLDLAW